MKTARELIDERGCLQNNMYFVSYRSVARRIRYQPVPVRVTRGWKPIAADISNIDRTANLDVLTDCYELQRYPSLDASACAERMGIGRRVALHA